jgi:hypothetical protein
LGRANGWHIEACVRQRTDALEEREDSPILMDLASAAPVAMQPGVPHEGVDLQGYCRHEPHR